ncbi:MAG: glycosyltransferase family A protein [Methanomassiliicoccales archaeon]
MEAPEPRPELDITVFILSYNRPEYLREMLLSVLSQTALPEEIVILDNGSDRGTREAVEDLLTGNVKWVGADHNHQSVWNFRRAYSSSDKKYFAILHDDDRLLPSFLETMVGRLEADERLVAVSCNGYRINKEGRRTPLKLLPGEPEGMVYLKNAAEAALRYSYGYVPFPNIVYRNGFPQRISIREEFGKVWDSVFITDLAAHGWIGILDELLFEYRHHAGQDSSEFPEDLLQNKEEFLLSVGKGSELQREIARRVALRQSRRLSGLFIVSLVKKKDPRYFFERLSRFGYRRASVLGVIYYLLFNRLVFYQEKWALKSSRV